MRCSRSFFVFGHSPPLPQCLSSPSDWGESRTVVNIEFEPSTDGDEEDNDESGEDCAFAPAGVTWCATGLMEVGECESIAKSIAFGV